MKSASIRWKSTFGEQETEYDRCTLEMDDVDRDTFNSLPFSKNSSEDIVNERDVEFSFQL